MTQIINNRILLIVCVRALLRVCVRAIVRMRYRDCVYVYAQLWARVCAIVFATTRLCAHVCVCRINVHSPGVNFESITIDNKHGDHYPISPSFMITFIIFN